MYLRSKKNENFQSTLPRGSDKINYILIITYVLSIHAPSRERPGLFGMSGFVTTFNPRSLAGATVWLDLNLPANFLSIHAPSRERPVKDLINNTSVNLSIHAPSRERHLHRDYNSRKEHFQSTLPRGSDHRYQWAMDDMQLSIHAPSRERPLD